MLSALDVGASRGRRQGDNSRFLVSFDWGNDGKRRFGPVSSRGWPGPRQQEPVQRSVVMELILGLEVLVVMVLLLQLIGSSEGRLAAVLCGRRLFRSGDRRFALTSRAERPDLRWLLLRR